MTGCTGPRRGFVRWSGAEAYSADDGIASRFRTFLREIDQKYENWVISAISVRDEKVVGVPGRSGGFGHGLSHRGKEMGSSRRITESTSMKGATVLIGCLPV
jgi:hypothetical protein